MTYLVLRGVMRALVALVLGPRLHVEGLENVPRRGGVLVVGNHVGMIDPPLTGSLIPRTDVHYMAKSEQFRSRPVRWLFRGFQAFPVVRGTPDRVALRHTLDLLRSGQVVLVYPEGSRSADGRMGVPQPGIGFIARRAGVPVVPVAIWGTERVLPRGARWPRRTAVHLRYGTPMSFAVSSARGRDDNAAVAEAVMGAVAVLLPERYRPAGHPASAA